MNTIVVTSTKQNIKFGYEGEDNVTKIIFPYDESWLEYGEGNFEVRILRCGDEVAYTATEVVDDRQAMTLTMTVTDIELSVRGRGEMQLCYVCPDSIKKSPIYQYTVNRSIDYKYAVDPPEGSIIASVEKSLSEIKNTTNRLSNSVISIENSINDVNSQIDNINNKISEFDEEIDSIGEVETRVDNLETSIGSINGRINTAEGNINENIESISDLNESVTELENRKVTDLETSGGKSDSGKYLTVGTDGKIKATSLTIPPTITVDDSLSTTSKNPVQNKVIKTELNNINSNIETCNTEISKLNGSLGEVSEHTRNLWLSSKDVVFTRYTAVEVNLPAGKYTFSAEIESSAEGNFCRVQFNDTSNAQLTYVRLDKRIRDIQAFTLTDTCKYIYLYSGADASASTGYEATFSDIMVSATQYAYPYIKPVSAVDAVSREGVNSMTDMLGYDKPNLIDKPFTPINNMNGITGTLDKETWEITYNGTATASFGTNIALTLPAGKYYLSGLNGGSSGTFFYRFMYADNTYFDQTKDTVRPSIEITEEQQVRLYVRFVNGAVINNVKISPMIRPESIWNPTYARYGEYAIYKSLRPLVDYSEFNWSGKKMVVIGDSIARGGAGLMTYAIGSILNLASIKNYAIGGSSIASRSEYDATYTPVVTKYLDADTDADIVLVHAGTNDYSSQVPIGDTDSEDITTFNGALNVLMAGLRSRYPTSLIVFSGILDRINDDLTTPCQTYRDALEAACRRHFMVFYNGYKETNLYMKGENNPYTSDGLHPNQVGANILGRSIAGFIKWH